MGGDGRPAVPPRDIFEELDGVSLADQEKLLYRNTVALNERRPA